MSIITRTFVVLVTVLAVAMVALVVTFVANTENYKEQRDKEQTKVKIEQAKGTDLQTKLKESADQIEVLNSQHRTALADKEGLVTNLQQELLKRDVENADLRNKNAQYEANASRFVTVEATNKKMLDGVLKEASDLRTAVATQNVKLADKDREINKLDSEKAQAESQFERVNIQKVAVDDELKKMQHWWEQVPMELRVPIAEGRKPIQDAPIPLSASIVRAEKPTNAAATLAEINIGKNDGVNPGMVFRIFRRKGQEVQFLGRLTIVSVDDRRAAGTVDLEQTDRGPIVAGDLVQSGSL